MKGFRHIGQKLGEYDPSLMKKLYSLTMRLSPIIWRDDSGGSNDANDENKKSSSGNSKDNSDQENDDRDEKAKKKKHDRDEQIEYVFKTFDRNKSGYITLDEFSDVMKSYQITISEQKSLELFAIADVDCYGIINEEGLRKILSK